jgi:hypothetical protein
MMTELTRLVLQVMNVCLSCPKGSFFFRTLELRGQSRAVDMEAQLEPIRKELASFLLVAMCTDNEAATLLMVEMLQRHYPLLLSCGCGAHICQVSALSLI